MTVEYKVTFDINLHEDDDKDQGKDLKKVEETKEPKEDEDKNKLKKIEETKKPKEEDKNKLKIPEDQKPSAKENIDNVRFDKKTETLEKDVKGIKNQIGDIQGKVGEAASLLQNPGSIVSKIAPALTATGPFGIALAAIIGTGLFAATIGKTVIMELAKKGRPLNRDFVQLVSELTNSTFSRQERIDRAYGITRVIVHSGSGFSRVGASDVIDSYERTSERKISEITSLATKGLKT